MWLPVSGESDDEGHGRVEDDPRRRGQLLVQLLCTHTHRQTERRGERSERQREEGGAARLHSTLQTKDKRQVHDPLSFSAAV